jgi:glycerol-3-phosphate dehydrogenase
MISADVLIVGGGMQGAAMALSAARRGLRPLVVERDRVASGATGNSYGIVHGGLRYLQSLNLKRFVRSRQQQNWFLESFPDLVRPLRCAMPLYRGNVRSPALFRAAFLLERSIIALCGLQSSLPCGRVLPADGIGDAEFIPRAGLVGAAEWYDGGVLDIYEVVNAILESAGGRNEIFRSGIEVRSAHIENGKIVGLGATDRSSGCEISLRAPIVVLCVGAASRDLARSLDRDEPRLSTATLAFNLLLEIAPQLASTLAVSVKPGRGRSYFLRSLDGGLFAGTCYVPCPGATTPHVSKDNIAWFIGELDRCVPSLRLANATVRKVTAGLLPDTDGSGKKLRTDDIVWDHGSTGGPSGLYTVLGTKFTTAFGLSEQVAGLIWPRRDVKICDRGAVRPQRGLIVAGSGGEAAYDG